MAYKNTDSCLKKAGENEMLFVLRAQDFTSPLVVMEWLKINFNNTAMPDEKLREAFEAALAMRNFPGRKYPD